MKPDPKDLIMQITRWLYVFKYEKENDMKISNYYKKNPKIPIIIGLLQYYDQNFERPIYDYIKGLCDEFKIR